MSKLMKISLPISMLVMVGLCGIGIASAQPTITSYTISNTIISPNGDGVQDTTNIDVEFSESVYYIISIEDITGIVVYNWPKRSAKNPTAKTWNGTYGSNGKSNGTVVPNGNYIVNITFENKTINFTAYNNTETITVLTPRVSIISPRSVSSGDTFPVNITVDPAGTAIAGAQFDFSFDQSMVTVNGIIQGDLLTQNGADIYPNETTDAVNRSLFVQINNTVGTASYACAIITPKASVSSAGILAIINLTANSSAGGQTAILGLTNVIISDPSSVQVNTIVTNGTVSIEAGYAIGDVNGDNAIDYKDAPYLAKHVIGLTGFETLYGEGDVNCDNAIDYKDAPYLAKHVIGLTGFEKLGCK